MCSFLYCSTLVESTGSKGCPEKDGLYYWKTRYVAYRYVQCTTKSYDTIPGIYNQFCVCGRLIGVPWLLRGTGGGTSLISPPAIEK